jgi:hypothetical protein
VLAGDSCLRAFKLLIVDGFSPSSRALLAVGTIFAVASALLNDASSRPNKGRAFEGLAYSF